MTESIQNYTPRLKTRYQDEIRTKLNDEFSYDTVSYTHLRAHETN